jgi:hypothetical protein
MENDELYIKKEFKRNASLFEYHLNRIKSIQEYKSIWSDSYLDFMPFESEISQIQKPKIFNRKPKNLTSKIETRFDNENIFYALRCENYKWGTIFYLSSSNEKIHLFYTEDDDENFMTLQQVKILFQTSDKVEKSLFYKKDSIEDEETFMIFNYNYNHENQLISIERNGYYEDSKNVLPTINYLFEYKNNGIKIFSKHLNMNGKYIENQIFPDR